MYVANFGLIPMMWGSLGRLGRFETHDLEHNLGPNLGLDGLRHALALKGMEVQEDKIKTPPFLFSNFIKFHIETRSFGLQKRSVRMHCARSPFSELYRGLKKWPFK